jgi:2-haloacid dehalogenase
MATPRAFLFDAYGTLFDVHTVVEAGRAVTDDPQALSSLWRQKQLEYTWLRSLMGRYVDFWEVTRAALSFALRRLGLRPSPAQADALMEAYLTLGTFPEVRMALAHLAPAPLGILSNGSPMMLDAAVRSAGLEGMFQHLLSVDEVQCYKPSPRVWGRAPSASRRGRSSSCRPMRGTSPARAPSATARAGATGWGCPWKASRSRRTSRWSGWTRSPSASASSRAALA